MTNELMAFLYARYDDAEREAQRLDGEEWGWSVSKLSDSPATGRISAATDPYDLIAVLKADDADKYDDRTRHIARHDPAHVLRDIKAKRRMLDALEEADPQGHGACISATYRVEDALCDLAAVYEDHPDYQEEWKP